MNKRLKKILTTFVYLFLTCFLSFTSACSCSTYNGVGSVSYETNYSYPEKSVSRESESNTSITPPQPDEDIFEDYELDKVDSFVYSLIYSDLTQQYDTFVSYVTVPNLAKSTNEDYDVYGISYVDYEEGYIDEFGKTYFSAGFISFPDEPEIEISNVSIGLEIVSIEESYDDYYSYVYSYTTEDVQKHCVIDNKYVKYDIINGALSYSVEEYSEGMMVDYERGNIYNYDTEEYVYIVTEQDYVPVAGVSIIGEADYEDIMEEVNRILQTQEANLTYSEIVSFITQSQDALHSYLLGLQEETFMGIPTDQLVEIVGNLDPLQHLQIGVDENGLTTIDIIEVTKLPTLWEKVATSIVCAAAVVGGVVCSIYGGGIIGGTIIGAAMEAFSQVVIANTPINDIQWSQIAVAAVAGAIAGGVSGAINGIAVKGASQVFLREVADTLCDSIIGGTEFFVNSLIDGQNFGQACKSFGYGVVAGLVIGGTIKVATVAIKGGIKLIKKSATNSVEKINGRQVNKLSVDATGDAVSEIQEKSIQKAVKRNAKESIDGIAHYYDDNDNLYRVGNNLLPDSEYKINGYSYKTDNQGRIISAEGKLKLKTREKRLPIRDSINDIGKGYQQIGDNRGHLIGDQFDGSNGLENMIPQNSKINQVDFRNFENELASLVKNGSDVSVNIVPVYEGNSTRPVSILVSYVIDGAQFFRDFTNY